MCSSNSSTAYSNYDPIAREYAHRLADELDHKPLDKELLKKFARLVRSNGVVCDLGCGPGHVARFLADQGVSVFGLDRSSNMIEQAKTISPGIAFIEGDLRSTGLDSS